MDINLFKFKRRENQILPINEVASPKKVMNMLITHDGNFQDFPDFTNQLALLQLVLQCKREKTNCEKCHAGWGRL